MEKKIGLRTQLDDLNLDAKGNNTIEGDRIDYRISRVRIKVFFNTRTIYIIKGEG